MEIYILRHGETVWNFKGITQGRSNNRLSKRGIEQIKEVALKYKNTNFDEIFVSPLMRTVQTANIFNKYHNKKLKKDERIIEIDQGIFAGRKKDSFTPEEIEMRKNRTPETGMETQKNIVQRVKDFLDDISKKYKDKRILVVTHRGIAKILYYLINNIDTNEKIEDMSLFKNAEIRKCIYNSN